MASSASASGELKPGTVLAANGSNWRIGKKLGKGNYGFVYECTAAAGAGAGAGAGASSASSSEVHAIKVAAVKGASKNKKPGATSQGAAMAYTEYLIYTANLRYHPNLPFLPRNPYGNDGTTAWLVLQKLDGTLQQRMERCGGRVPAPTAATIMMQLVSSR
jgi:hypothetical protein